MIEFSSDEFQPGAICLHTEMTLPRPISLVFDFFSDAGNLATITPPSLGFRILTPLPIKMEAGTLIDYRISLRGVPIRWQTEISVWEPTYRFVDRQVRGPYRLWEHTHTFLETAEGTRVIDDVRFQSPLGFLTHRLFIRSELTKIFRYRHDRLTELMGTSAAEQLT